MSKYRILFLLTFILCLNSYGQNSGRFGLAGFERDSIFAGHYARFQNAVEHDDSSCIANLVDYPIKATPGGKKPVTYKFRDAKDFLGNYSQIFDARLRIYILSRSADSLNVFPRV